MYFQSRASSRSRHRKYKPRERKKYMQVKIVTIPLLDVSAAEAELNHFLRSHRVLQIDKNFTPENDGYWSVFVTYMDGVVIMKAVLQIKKKATCRRNN